MGLGGANASQSVSSTFGRGLRQMSGTAVFLPCSAPQTTSRQSRSGSLGKAAVGSAWYQYAIEAMSSWSGR